MNLHDKKLNIINLLKEREAFYKHTFKIATRAETKLALINFALDNFRDYEYDLFEIAEFGYKLPFSLKPSQYQTKKLVTKFESPQKYIDLVEEHFEEDWYYKFIFEDLGELQLVIYTEEDFKRNEKEQKTALLPSLIKASAHMTKSTELVESNGLLRGKAVLLIEDGQMADLERVQLYNSYSCWSKDMFYPAFLEMTSGKMLLNGVYNVILKPRKFALENDGFEIIDAQIIEKIETKETLLTNFLKEIENYSQKDFEIKSKLLVNKLK